jgi:HopA1 effector protein family
MQLLDSSRLPSSPETLSDSLKIALEDVIHHVQIESDFCIRHPDYEPLQPPPEIVERFQQLPPALQHKYLSLQLQGFLYGIYYNGSLKSALALGTKADDLALHQNLENNTFLGVDVAFYERLHESNCGEGYFDGGWFVLRQEEDGSLAVTKGGLTLHIDPALHLAADTPAVAGDTVAIRLPRNRVQNGFYMAIGNAGANHPRPADSEPAIVRIYCNLDPDGAVAVMGSLTQQLNQLAVPFAFKALYNPSDYDRYDAAVLYFDKQDYDTVSSVLRVVYAAHQSHFQTEVPLFTKLLAPGLALAEEPNHKFAEEESFGMNRCQIIVNGLMEARQKGDESPEGRIAAILQHFSLLNIELQHPYLNPNSADVYTPLAL